MRHVISVSDFDGNTLEQLFTRAAYYKASALYETRLPLARKRIASIFYQPSTRTRLSFEAAALALGAGVIGTENAAEFSSAIKGESLEDTIRVVAEYVDCIILRHPEEGAAQRACEVSSVPIINAGDGTGEHPTQAFLDLFTIQECYPREHPIVVTCVGDLDRGRTIHSLIKLLGDYGNGEILTIRRLHLVAPNEMSLPHALLQEACRQIGDVHVHTMLERGVLKESSVLYMTRAQNEHGIKSRDYTDVSLTTTRLGYLPQDALILHPLPRNSELPVSIDTDPRARYFKQAKNGLYVRMALLEMLVGQK